MQSFLRDLGELRRAEDEREQLRRPSVPRRPRSPSARHGSTSSAAWATSSPRRSSSSELSRGSRIFIVREFADWCVVDVVEDGNAHELTRVAVARAEPTEGNGARRMGDSPGASVRAVAYGGRSRLVPSPGEDGNGEPVRFLDGLEARSVISVPLRARKQPFRALHGRPTVRGQTPTGQTTWRSSRTYAVRIEHWHSTARGSFTRGRGAGGRRPRARARRRRDPPARPQRHDPPSGTRRPKAITSIPAKGRRRPARRPRRSPAGRARSTRSRSSRRRIRATRRP